MAMQSCIGKIAQSIGMDCSSPIVGGYTGRAIIFLPEAISYVNYDEDNENIVVGFGLTSAPLCIDNAMLSTPFEGSTTTGTNENGTPEFVKVFSGRILTRGADVSKNIVEPLAGGELIVIAEKQDRILGNFGYEFIGLRKPLRCVDQSTIVRNESENEGSIAFSLQTTEDKFEVNIDVTKEGYNSAREWFQEVWDILHQVTDMSLRSRARMMSLEDEGENRVVFSTKK